MKMDTASERTTKIVAGGIMVAMATVLSMIKVFELPYGGSITLCSMLPITFYAYINGAKWGVGVGFVYSIIQLLLGTDAIRGFDFISAAGVVLFDFILAFSILGIAGMFKNKIEGNPAAFAAGTAVAGILRYICHVISGAIFFGQYAEWFFSQDGMSIGPAILGSFSGWGLALIYSIIYNLSFMLPELIITTFAAGFLMKLTQKQLFKTGVARR